MSLADKVDFLFKKQQGIPFTDPGAAIESSIDAYKRVIPSRQIYAQEIPATAPAVSLSSSPVGTGAKYQGTGTYSYIWKYVDVPLTAIVSGVSYRYGNGTGANVLADSIPPLYDLALSYNVTVKVGAATPANNDAIHPWLLDTDAGVLTFMNGRNDSRNGQVIISFWRYEGTKGLGSGGGGGGGAGGVGDAADGQLLYDNSGSVSGSSITYVPSGTATYTYTGSAEKYTGIAVGTKTYADGSRRYVLGRMQQLIPTAQGNPPSRDISGFYGGVTDFPSSRQPFNHLTYDPSHNMVTKTFYHTDGYTYALVAIGNRVAWRDASGADTVVWMTYDLPAGEIIYDVAYGVTFTDARLMVVTESLRYMTVMFVSGQPLTFSALTDINGRTGIQQQGNRLSGLYFFETAVRMSVFIFTTRVAWVPSRVFMVTYRRDTAENDINLQKNVSVLQASCQAVSSTYSNDFTTAANNYYTNLMSAPLAFKYAPYGIMTLVIDSPIVTNVLVGYNVVWGATALYGNVKKSRVFGFYQGNNASNMSILAFINTNSYDTSYTFYEASIFETIYNSTNGEFFNYAIYNLVNLNNFITRTRSMRYHVISPSTNQYTIFPYSSSNVFQPILIDFNAIIYITYYSYPYPINSLNYDCSNTLVVTHPYSNYLLAAETPSVLSIKRYSYGDASNNTLEGRTAYPTYTSINGIVSYAAVPGTQQTTDLSASNVEAVAGSTSIASTAKNARYTNGTQQATTTTRTPILEVNDIGVMMLPNKTLQINSTSWNGGLRFGTAPTQTSSLNYMILRGPPNVDYRYGRWQNSIIVHIPDNSDNNFAVLSPNATPRFVVNTGNGNVGIGTADPRFALDMGIGTGININWKENGKNIYVKRLQITPNDYGTPDLSYNMGIMRGSRDVILYAQSPDSDAHVRLWPNYNETGPDAPSTTPALTAYHNGNVGIGLLIGAPPFDKLDINGALRIQDRNQLPSKNETGTALYPGVINLAGDYGPQIRSIYPNDTWTDNISLQFLTNAASNSTTLVPRMHIEALSGNVGIGTTTPLPQAKLTVYKDITNGEFNNSNPYPGQIILQTGGGTGRLIIGVSRTDGEYVSGGYIQASDFHSSLDHGSNMSINPKGGYVGIGTRNPRSALDIIGNTTTSGDVDIYPPVGNNAGVFRVHNDTTYGSIYIIPSKLVFDTYNNSSPIELQGSQIIMNPSTKRVQIPGNSGLPTTGNATLMVGSTGVTGIPTSVGVFTYPGPGGSVQNNLLISIYGHDYMWCSAAFLASSDMRIKKNITEINDGDALNKLRLIEPSEYNYIDERKGTSRIYGFIAQQVYQHFPNAAPKTSQIIPCFYQICDASFNESSLTLVDISNREILTTVIPGKSKVQIIDIANKEHTPTVIAVDASAGTLIFDISGLSVKEDISGGKMFLYGMEVDDFHTLNKDYLFTINFSATQELDREVQRLRTDNTALTDRVAALETRATTLEARVAPLDNRVAALETQNTALQQKLDALLSRLGITDL